VYVRPIKCTVRGEQMPISSKNSANGCSTGHDESRLTTAHEACDDKPHPFQSQQQFPVTGGALPEPTSKPLFLSYEKYDDNGGEPSSWCSDPTQISSVASGSRSKAKGVEVASESIPRPLGNAVLLIRSRSRTSTSEESTAKCRTVAKDFSVDENSSSTYTEISSDVSRDFNGAISVVADALYQLTSDLESKLAVATAALCCRYSQATEKVNSSTGNKDVEGIFGASACNITSSREARIPVENSDVRSNEAVKAGGQEERCGPESPTVAHSEVTGGSAEILTRDDFWWYEVETMSE